MNCDDVSELLPWLLNGSLESGEEAEVRRHLATCERCRAALGETREAWTTFDQHLPSEALVALAWGEAPAGIEAAVADRHLASCPQCAAELELARMSRQFEKDEKIVVFPAPSPRPRRAGRAAALAAGLAAVVGWTGWLYESQQAGDMAAQLARRPAAQEGARTAPAPPAATANPALAAQLEQLKKGMADYKQRTDQQLQQAAQQLAELDSKAQQARAVSEPQVNAWSGLLNPVVVERGPNAATPEERVIPGDRMSVLSLGTESEGEALRELEIRDAGGALVWTKPGLRSDAKSQQFSFGLPAGALKPGRYTIDLYEKVGGQRVKRESYYIRVK